MQWNYRVISRKLDDEAEFGIYEVYYGEDSGEIVAWTESRIRPHGYTLEELSADLELMAEALEKPILAAEDLPGRWAERARPKAEGAPD